MGKVRTHVILSLGILLAWCARAFALDPLLDISQYAHTSWKVRDGFVQGAIFSIAQTPDGYLWLGTEFGLYRFDGLRAVHWQPPAGAQLPGGRIRSLLAGRGGTLWIGADEGLASLKDGKLARHLEVRTSAMHLLEDSEGTVWIAGAEPGRYRGALCSIRSGKTQCYGGDVDLGVLVTALYEDRDGTLWVGTTNALWRWKPGSPQRFSMKSLVVCVFQDENGALLVGTREGVRQFIDGKFESYPISSSAGLRLEDFRVLRDIDGGLWIGTNNQGIVHVGPGANQAYRASDGLSGDFVTAILEDREGCVWVATGTGLDRFRGSAVPAISRGQGLSNSTANSVLAAEDGSVWIATVDGLNRLMNGHISIYRSQRSEASARELPNVRELAGKRLPSDHVGSLLQDPGGRVWVSTSVGVAYLEKDRFSSLNEAPRGIIRLLAEGAGNIWIVGYSRHLRRLFCRLVDRRVVETVPWAKLGNEEQIDATLGDSQGGVWLGFHGGGLVYFKDGQVRASYSAADGLGQGRVSHLRFGSRGALWAATEGGLSRIKDGRIATITSRSGLPCDAVHWSMEDDDHSVWLYTSCGLARIERAEFDAWVSDPKHMVKTTVFGSSDGVWSHLYPPTGYGPVVSKARDGKIWFVSGDGVSVIDPHNLHENKLPPPVHIEKIVADDKVYDGAQNGIHLPALVRNLTIDYTALSLVVPEKVHFRYKLEGQDKDWREVVNDREVQYSNLPAKHYKFRVIASNNSGVWNEEGAALDFIIPPAWYQTNWFRTLCVAAFLAMIWGIHELRVRQLAHQFNVRLEERVSERTRIARDLHDTLLQSFQGLLLQFQAISYRLQPGEIKNALEAVTAAASQAVTEGRDSIQGLRASTVEKNDLAEAIRAIGGELASAAINQSSVAFEVMVEGRRRSKYPIVRDEVYRIAVEALRNAFRHSQATKIEVELLYEDKDFKIRVRDNGKGINRDVLSGDGRTGHFGLHGMRERAKLIGGELAIWSEVDGGTEIELSIPASRAYTRSARSSWFFRRFSQKDTDVKEKVES